ncbi:MAG: uracil phosphoribosyltransferase, partial [Longimicrobiales bacterium]|nr:uracil phosphoribosyltransferase [Longimicrobiales bacterium]
MLGFPNLTVLDHPLIQHKLSFLRHHETPKKLFKELVDEIATLMAYEVTRDLPLKEVPIRTPLEDMVARRIRGKKPVIVPI